MGQDLIDPPGKAGSGGDKHHFHHDMEDGTSLSTTIVSALAQVEGVDATELGFALHDYFDTDALDALFAPKLNGMSREGGRLTFTLPDYSVTVHSDGHVVISELPEPPAP